MLQLKNIVKTYVTGDVTQDALKGVSITFRENEFVSILGQSGSGKTTMLNIIGGLDRYTSGDLVINGVSTEKYKDSDWDYYRNNSIGFVFQSYNLIPHQSVLANVEMAMTLAGVSKKERRGKAVAVLKKVGLHDHMHKKPNQMSGGQMQRVAIARALVNNPDILLADEPTGALDSETSIQIMELLKEIAKDKLVIMVTHNPELAEMYSTRIVKLLDGEIISDTDPYTAKEEDTHPVRHKKISMSFLTALSLSFNNLRTKKGRTLLTAFAGSIGIIGIALVLAMSAGLNDYIASIQKDTMSSYPLTISSESVDVSDVMGKRKETVENMHDNMQETNANISGIYADYQSASSNILTSNLKENNLSAFKKYLDDPSSEIRQYVGENGIIYSYDLDFSVYSYDADGKLVNSSSEDTDGESTGLLGGAAGGIGIASKLKSITSVFGGSSESGVENFSELMKGSSTTVSSLITDSYDLLYGAWPENYDEVILVLDRENKISADVMYKLGLITKDDYDGNTEKAENGDTVANTAFNYADFTGHEFYLVTASDRYEKNENGTFSYIDDTDVNEEKLLKNAVKLKITGVVRPNGEENATEISTAIGYTYKLTDHIISHTNSSEVVTAQEKTPKINVLNGVEFEVPDDKTKVEDAKEYIKNLDASEKTSVYTLIKYYESANKKAENDGKTDESENLEKMTDSEKAAAFDKWLDSADDEVLLALFDSVLSGTSELIGTGKTDTESSSAASSSNSSTTIFDKLDDCLIVKFFSQVLDSLGLGNLKLGNIGLGNFNLGSLFSSGNSGSSNIASSLVGSMSDSSKISMIKEYAGKLSESEKATMYTLIKNYNLDTADAETIKSFSSLLTSGAAGTLGGTSSGLSFGQDSVATLLDNWLENSPDEEILIKVYDEYIGVSSYDDNMEKFGYVSYDTPTAISIYADSFDSKDGITESIANYNSSVTDELKITYTDYVSLLTSSITTIIDTVSYAIIAFVAISLVVSCIMIGIITHISVMERTKEIGILRALGASKTNISQVFNAETFIIGCCAGLLGVGISQAATIPINIIIAKLSGLEGLSARLPVSSSLALIALSIVITIVGGLLPAKKAAKKDPVIALRTE